MRQEQRKVANKSIQMGVEGFLLCGGGRRGQSRERVGTERASGADSGSVEQERVRHGDGRRR
jgi:hypothetical protein